VSWGNTVVKGGEIRMKQRKHKETDSLAAPDFDSSQNGKTVLVVDDQENIRVVVKILLDSLGYDVLTASNGKEAIEVASRFKGDIHLAILDINMPVMGGIETFPILKEIKPGMKVIICTGDAGADSARRLLHIGADAILHKPFGIVSLRRKIRKIMRKDRMPLFNH